MAADLLSVWTGLVAAFLLLVLACLLVLLRFSSGANRSFALLLTLQAGALAVLSFYRLSDGPLKSVWFDLAAYFLLAQPAVVTYFFIAYTARPRRARRWWAAGLFVTTAALELLYATDHCIVRCQAGASSYLVGPLYPVEYGFPLAIALVGLALVLRTRPMPQSTARSCMSLVGATLALTAFIDAALQDATFLVPAARNAVASQYSPALWANLAFWARGLAIVPVLLTLILWANGHSNDPQRRAGLRAGTLVVIALGSAFAAFYALTPQDPTAWETSPATLLIGAWRLITPALVAYGLLRHRLFDLDPVLKATIGPTAIASVFLAVFFTVSKVAENLLGNTYGAIGGGVAAGLLLFALSPLERLGSRISHAVVPKAKATRDRDHDELRSLYRDQAVLVWSDGVMRPSERALLDNLRKRFGIPADVAASLEEEALVVHTRTPRPSAGRAGRRPGV